MATTTVALFRGAATTSTTTTLYTVPASTTTVVTNIVAVNTSGSSQTFTLTLDSVDLATAVTLAANSSSFIDLKQVMSTGKIIKGGASATSVNFHISGVQIS